MHILETLIGCAGNWRGTNTLQDPTTGKPEETASTAVITPLLGGRFVRFDYTWLYQGTLQEGSILFGYDKQSGAIAAHWIDSWHMGNKVMVCEGQEQDNNALSVVGSYAAPPGPDWGWRINLTMGDGTLGMSMNNIWPDGREELAVEAHYTRE